MLYTCLTCNVEYKINYDIRAMYSMFIMNKTCNTCSSISTMIETMKIMRRESVGSHNLTMQRPNYDIYNVAVETSSSYMVNT